MKSEFDDDVEIYKYIQHEYMRSLFEQKELYFRQIRKWPDMMEGFLDRLVSPQKTNLRYGSCWTLHKGIARIVDEGKQKKAIEEIKRNGVDSMWRTYCPNGGIRIKTTIGKIKAQVKAYCDEHGFIFEDGPVVYEHHTDTKRSQIDKLCFSKSPNFYTDDEYRFIITTGKPKKDGFSVEIDNIVNFIDEVLVSPIFPGDPKSLCVSRCIRDYMDGKNFTVWGSCLYSKEG